MTKRRYLTLEQKRVLKIMGDFDLGLFEVLSSWFWSYNPAGIYAPRAPRPRTVKILHREGYLKYGRVFGSQLAFTNEQGTRGFILSVKGATTYQDPKRLRFPLPLKLGSEVAWMEKRREMAYNQRVSWIDVRGTVLGYNVKNPRYPTYVIQPAGTLRAEERVEIPDVIIKEANNERR